MNIRTIQCPSCGANLKVEDLNQSLFYCNYCGAAIQLETNHNKGYDMELGRLDARGELADKLIEKIEKIKDVLVSNGNAAHDLEYYPHEIAGLKGELSYLRTSGWVDALLKPFGVGIGILFIGAFLVVTLNKLLPGPLLTLVELLILLAPIYLPVIGLIRKLKKHSNVKEQIANCKVRLDEAQQIYNDTEAYIKENAEVEIPPQFRREGILDYIIKGLKAREFVSLEQAFFKCEETERVVSFGGKYSML